MTIDTSLATDGGYDLPEVIVPETADGQSADRFGSLHFLKAGLAPATTPRSSWNRLPCLFGLSHRRRATRSGDCDGV
jgi:hypothetical protein